MIVSPPKAGKTTLLKDVAKSILRNNPDMHLIILLIDERLRRLQISGRPSVAIMWKSFILHLMSFRNIINVCLKW